MLLVLLSPEPKNILEKAAPKYTEIKKLLDQAKWVLGSAAKVQAYFPLLQLHSSPDSYWAFLAQTAADPPRYPSRGLVMTWEDF